MELENGISPSCCPDSMGLEWIGIIQCVGEFLRDHEGSILY